MTCQWSCLRLHQKGDENGEMEMKLKEYIDLFEKNYGDFSEIRWAELRRLRLMQSGLKKLIFNRRIFK